MSAGNKKIMPFGKNICIILFFDLPLHADFLNIGYK
jgi:hypothetical protein